MVKTTIVLITVMATATVTSVGAFPLTHPDNVTWSTPCRHDVDADLRRPRHCADAAAAGSDVTPTDDDVTVEEKTAANVTGRRAVWTHYPFAYDQWLGWYIAAIISGFILTLIFCAAMDRVKHAVIDYLDARLFLSPKASISQD